MNPWVRIYSPRPEASLRLFCFPFAGGAAQVFRNWGKLLPEGIEVCAIQLPGRWDRLQEAPFRKVSELIPALQSSLQKEFKGPFVFFGHSMGALLAFELARALRQSAGPMPLLLIVSAHPAPQLVSEGARKTFDLPEGELLSRLRDLKGTPTELLEHPEWMENFLPTLRADLEMVETYVYYPQEPLTLPLLALAGRQDREVSLEKMEQWRSQTQFDFKLKCLEGDHFFLKQEEKAVLKTLEQELNIYKKQ